MQVHHREAFRGNYELITDTALTRKTNVGKALEIDSGKYYASPCIFARHRDGYI